MAIRARGTRTKEPDSAAGERRLIGHARVSTEEQGTDPQLDELRDAGCAAIHQEHASGADRSRPVLAAAAARDRARRDPGRGAAGSIGHLLAVIEQLDAKGAYFRSLRDPIDTTTPQGMFSLQVLGAVAQLERALIAERTKLGCALPASAAGSAAIRACARVIPRPSARRVRRGMRRI